MTSLKTNTDIVNSALFRAGELTDGSSDYEAVALEYVNRAYKAIAAGGVELDDDVNEKWWWLRSTTPAVINLEPVIEDGTLNVTNNSAAIVFSSAPSKSLAGWFLRTLGTQDVFRISAHTAASVNATLDGNYTGPTAATESYTAFKLEYPLPADCMEILKPMRVYQDSKLEIDGIDLAALEKMYPLQQIWQGVPDKFAMIAQRKIRFSHQGGSSATDLIRVDFDYLVLPTELAKDTNEPLIPEEFRRTLADFACMFILLDKDDSKASDIGKMAKAGLRGMAKENRARSLQFSNSFGMIYPRQGQLAHQKYPLRTTGGRIIG